MMNFNKHLKEILYEHDFIVLPRLGAFIADFKIDESGEAAVPFKSFVFNNLLTSDENSKFFNFILSKETVAFSDIENQWNEYVSELKSEINAGKRKEIPGIGHFSKNDNIDFVFNSGINFYARDEALEGIPLSNEEVTEENTDTSIVVTSEETVSSLLSDTPEVPQSINESFESTEESINESVEKETVSDTIEESIEHTDEIETESFLEEVYEEEEERRSFWWWLLPLLLIGLAALTYWWMNRNTIDSSDISKETIDNVIISDSLANADSTISTEGLDANLKDTETNTDESTTDNSANFNTSNASKGAYHVWAGLFRNKRNAEKLQQKLIRNDIPAEIQLVKNMRRIYVPVQTESQARKMVKRIEQLTGDKAVYFEVD